MDILKCFSFVFQLARLFPPISPVLPNFYLAAAEEI